MGDRLIKKGLVLGIIVLFIGFSFMPITGSLSMEKRATQESLPFAYSTVDASGISLITVKVDGETGLNDWYVDDVRVNFTKSNKIAEIKYQVDGGWMVNYTEPFYITTDSTNHQLRWGALDYEGNYSEFEGPFYFKQDQTPPEIEFTYEWSGDKPPYTFTFNATATDATSTMQRVEFWINGVIQETIIGPGPNYIFVKKQWVPPTPSILRAIAYDFAGLSAYDDIINPSGIAVLESPIFSTDIVDEQGSQSIIQKTEIIGIEKELYREKPKSDCSITGVFDVASLVVAVNRKILNGNWIDDDFKITMMPDPYDMKDVYYKLDDVNWMRYTTPFVISTEDGFHTFWWYFVDYKGYISPPESIVFNIDRIPPTINFTREKIEENKIKFTANVSDETSGVDRVDFYVDGHFKANFSSPPYEWIYFGSERLTVKAVVYDKAGNSNSSSLSTWRSKSDWQTVSITSSQNDMNAIPSTEIDLVKKSTKTTLDGNTLYVGGSGSGNYSKIQDAIDDANDGDTVFVYDDSSPYEEIIIVNKSINIIGENRDTTFISEYYTDYYALIYINSDHVNFTGFTVIKNYYWTHILINSSYNKISNNNLTSTYNADYSGIEISNYKNYNIISDNIFYTCGTIGMYIHDKCTNTKIINNTFLNNWHDLDVRNSSHNTTIIGNKFLNTKCCCVIEISNSNNNIIKDNLLAPNYKKGINLYNSNNNTIQNNNIIGNNYYINDGIELSNSNDNNIFNNTLTISGLTLRNSFQNNVINNTVNNKLLVYLEDVSDSIIPDNTGQVILINCDNAIIQTQRINDTTDGILLWDTTNCTISDCFISKNIHGIYSYQSQYNTIKGNHISKNSRGIILHSSSNNNILYYNNLFGNYKNAEDGCTNLWYNTAILKGNYWDDYIGEDNDSDGIGDTPYPIPSGYNEDRYPLMYPWGNDPPDTPIIDGPTHGKVGVEYQYNFSLSDPENDSIYIRVDWGNGTSEPWQGPYDYDTIVKLNHTWIQKGTFTIKAQVKDIFNAESDWTSFEVTISKSKDINFNLLTCKLLGKLSLLERLILMLQV